MANGWKVSSCPKWPLRPNTTTKKHLDCPHTVLYGSRVVILARRSDDGIKYLMDSNTQAILFIDGEPQVDFQRSIRFTLWEAEDTLISDIEELRALAKRGFDAISQDSTTSAYDKQWPPFLVQLLRRTLYIIHRQVPAYQRYPLNIPTLQREVLPEEFHVAVRNMRAGVPLHVGMPAYIGAPVAEIDSTALINKPSIQPQFVVHDISPLLDAAIKLMETESVFRPECLEELDSIDDSTYQQYMGLWVNQEIRKNEVLALLQVIQRRISCGEGRAIEHEGDVRDHQSGDKNDEEEKEEEEREENEIDGDDLEDDDHEMHKKEGRDDCREDYKEKDQENDNEKVSNSNGDGSNGGSDGERNNDNSDYSNGGSDEGRFDDDVGMGEGRYAERYCRCLHVCWQNGPHFDFLASPSQTPT